MIICSADMPQQCGTYIQTDYSLVRVLRGEDTTVLRGVGLPPEVIETALSIHGHEAHTVEWIPFYDLVTLRVPYLGWKEWQKVLDDAQSTRRVQLKRRSRRVRK